MPRTPHPAYTSRTCSCGASRRCSMAASTPRSRLCYPHNPGGRPWLFSQSCAGDDSRLQPSLPTPVRVVECGVGAR
jgi:hypothetical protein